MFISEILKIKVCFKTALKRISLWQLASLKKQNILRIKCFKTYMQQNFL